MKVTTSVEVCPACLGPVGGGDPACETCRADGDDYRSIELLVTAQGRWRPATRATWGWDGGDPGDPGGWEGEVVSVTRSDTGAAVPPRDIPDPTWEVLDDLVADAAYDAARDEDTDEDREADREDERDYR